MTGNRQPATGNRAPTRAKTKDLMERTGFNPFVSHDAVARQATEKATPGMPRCPECQSSGPGSESRPYPCGDIG